MWSFVKEDRLCNTWTSHSLPARLDKTSLWNHVQPMIPISTSWPNKRYTIDWNTAFAIHLLSGGRVAPVPRYCSGETWWNWKPHSLAGILHSKMFDKLLLISCICVVIALIMYFFHWNRFIGFLIGRAIRLMYWNEEASSVWVEIGALPSPLRPLFH